MMKWSPIAGSVLQHDAFVHMPGTVIKFTCRIARNLLITEMEAAVAAPVLLEGTQKVHPHVICEGSSSRHSPLPWRHSCSLCSSSRNLTSRQSATRSLRLIASSFAYRLTMQIVALD